MSGLGHAERKGAEKASYCVEFKLHRLFRVSLMEGATTVKGFAILKPLLHYFFPSQESLCEDYLLSTTSDAVESKLHYDPSVFRIQLHSF